MFADAFTIIGSAAAVFVLVLMAVSSVLPDVWDRLPQPGHRTAE
ncbi:MULTISPECIES: hypothetical protein [Saccharopolyspora]|uniref:Uncharacterized protein n=1 Tax=Saccharopolyspora cebuensis TaxID=418759 RepID=A0ABV4CI16_9PSEU